MAANSNARRRPPAKSRRNPKSNVDFTDRERVKKAARSASGFIHVVRLIILSLGASAIAGTTIAIVNPPNRELAKPTDLPSPPVKSSTVSAFDSLKLTRSRPELTTLLEELGQKNSKLDANYLFVDLASGEYAGTGIDRVFPAASTIKLPILIALFQEIEQRKVRWDEQLTIDKKSIAAGSGELQTRTPGTTVSVLEAATKMMKISDNTATNLLIDRLGGKLALNERFRTWGLATTAINDRLPDLAGKNITTVGELSRSLVAIFGGASPAKQRSKLVSDASRSQILGMMTNTSSNTMLPRGLGKDAKIAHKTGDIGTAIADVGTIELPSGKVYLATVMVKRPHNDPAGPELVRQMSKTAYQHFSKQQPTTAATTFPKTSGE
jgi:beta-lactamase class A